MEINEIRLNKSVYIMPMICGCVLLLWASVPFGWFLGAGLILFGIWGLAR